jgi:hypothetical protein
MGVEVTVGWGEERHKEVRSRRRAKMAGVLESSGLVGVVGLVEIGLGGSNLSYRILQLRDNLIKCISPGVVTRPLGDQ